ncbi:MAG: GNAT family N-acetyltransferase [Blastocatellia bacterium]
MNSSELIQYQNALIFLRDGTPVRLRPLLAKDKAEFARAFERLSTQSRYQRFLSPVQELSPQMLAYLTEIDYVNHFAWGAFALAEAGAPLVGEARYVRLRDEPQRAEIAVAVIDEYHRRGLGQQLLRALVEVAVEQGIRRFVGHARRENYPILRLLRSAKAQIVPERSGVLSFAVDLAAICGELDWAPGGPMERLCSLTASTMQAIPREIVAPSY